ncbi:MAG TPA: arylesterase [Dongiaceae bacterium]|nr:arylesterase [Dongiaceae bacterium]
MQLTARELSERDNDILLLVGDSLGAGYGVQREHSWAYLLNEKFRAGKKNVQIVNASISGDTTAGGLARLEALLKQEKPRWVMIELGGNDGLRGMDIEAMQRNLEAMVQMSRQHGAQPLLVGIKIPPNYGRKYRERFEQAFVTVSEQQKVPFLPFLLDGVGGVDQYMQQDRIHPNALGQPAIADNVWKFLTPVLSAAPASP